MDLFYFPRQTEERLRNRYLLARRSFRDDYTFVNIYFRYNIYIYRRKREFRTCRAQNSSLLAVIIRNYHASCAQCTVLMAHDEVQMDRQRWCVCGERFITRIERTPLSRFSQDSFSRSSRTRDVTRLRKDTRAHRALPVIRRNYLFRSNAAARANGADSSSRSLRSQDRRRAIRTAIDERGTMEFHLWETGLFVSEIIRFLRPAGH